MSHYFDEQPSARSDERVVEVLLPDVTLRLRTDRGVFSHGRLDTGTSLLLHAAPAPPPAGDLLDLGCGAGAIALVLASRSPAATVWAVDVNARARELCASNARASGIGNVRVASPDDVPTGLRFGTIWSNPPIRIGKDELHRLLSTWLARLADDGAAVLVVQRHLGADSLQRWLVEQGWPTVRRASRAGYRLLEVSARPPAT